MLYEVVTKSGRVFEVNVDSMSTALESTWLRGTETASHRKPKHVDWLWYFRTSEIESYVLRNNRD